jgi:hypothetical protein
MTIELERKHGKHKETTILDNKLAPEERNYFADYLTIQTPDFLFSPLTRELVLREKLKVENGQIVVDPDSSENTVLFKNEINKVKISVIEGNVVTTLRWKKTKKHKK